MSISRELFVERLREVEYEYSYIENSELENKELILKHLAAHYGLLENALRNLDKRSIDS